MPNDDRLFQRVALTTSVVALIVFLALAAYFPRDWGISVNFVLGVAVGLASLGTLNWLVSRVTGSTAEGTPTRLLAAGLLHLAKYGLIALGFYLLLRSGHLRVPALAGGLLLPTAVLCLKSAGRSLNARVGVGAHSAESAPDGASDTPRSA
jgi:hypothetical protein